jgi:hypothetical protein
LHLQDITAGQIVLKVPVFWIPISVPVFIANWTLSRLPDGSWDRVTKTLGVPSSIATYKLRQVVSGEGKPGPYFNQWLKARGGEPFMYGVRVSP